MLQDLKDDPEIVTGYITRTCYTAFIKERGGPCMQGGAWGNEYRTTIVCVDQYQDRVFSGRIYHPYLADGDSFHSLMEFFWKMEDLLDTMQFPQSFTAVRRFSKPPLRSARSAGGGCAGRTVRDVCGSGFVSAKCQLARFGFLAGGESGGEIPQCLGVGVFDGQRTDVRGVLPHGDRIGSPIGPPGRAYGKPVTAARMVPMGSDRMTASWSVCTGSGLRSAGGAEALEP